MQTIKKEQIDRLRKDILCLKRLGSRPCDAQSSIELGPLLDNMPEQIFPTGVIHEFLSPTLRASTAANGFISAVISSLIQNGKPCLWVGMRSMVFPPALKIFGIDPHRIIFIDVAKEKEALWAIEEALKCEALGAVIGEVMELDFTRSRRLQLAVENSRVTGFINRIYPHSIQPTASVARWRITPVASQSAAGLPGIGFPRWKVELIKIRNGKPGCWLLEWSDSKFRVWNTSVQEIKPPLLKTGAA